jgi:integrase
VGHMDLHCPHTVQIRSSIVMTPTEPTEVVATKPWPETTFAIARTMSASLEGPLLFPAPGDGPLPVRRFSARLWKPAAEDLGVTPHQFKHLHATQHLELGRPITEVARRLGHRNPRVTMEVYAR